MKYACPCLSAIASVLLLAQSAWAQELPVYMLKIEAQPLADALQDFAGQSGLQVMFFTDVSKGRRATPLEGRFTRAEALCGLLSGTGLSYRLDGPGTVTVTAADRPGALPNPECDRSAAPAGRAAGENVQNLGAVNVFGTLEDSLNVGSKTGLSLRETPKSVTVMTRERLDAQNLTTLADSLKQATGVTVVSYTANQNAYFSRGFQVQTVQLDGGASAFTGGGFSSYMAPDMAAYDHVEVLRGVDGMYTGAGEPGGVINLVRKRAKRDLEFQFNQSLGRWDFRRSEFDVTGPLTDDGRLRGRMVVAREDKHYFYDRAESGRSLAFATAEYDLTPSTLLVAGASYERRKEDGYFLRGLPRYADGRDLGLPRSTALNTDWNYEYTTNKEMFLRAEQTVGETGVLKLNLTRMDREDQRRIMNAYGAVDPATLGGVQALGSGGDYASTQELADLSLNGTFGLFGRQHRYTVGIDYARVAAGDQLLYNLVGYTYPNGAPIDVFNYDASLYQASQAIPYFYYPDNEQSQSGFYATVGFQLADTLRLTVGGRYGRYRYLNSYQDIAVDGTRTVPVVSRYEDSKFIPSVALSYDFMENWTAYASYAETFKVQANLLEGPPPGTPMSPVTGGGYELGVKGELFGHLNAAMAIYRVERNGQGVQDPMYPITPGTLGSVCCYLQRASIVSQGLDMELSGLVLPGWQLFGGYTYNHTETSGVTSRELYSSGAYNLTQTPRHMFKMWTTWMLPTATARWTANLGVVAQTDTYVTGTALAAPGSTQVISYRFNQAPYAIWNASVQYRLNDSWTLGLYMDNLFDKTYYQVIAGTTGENVYGTPRNYVLNLRGNW